MNPCASRSPLARTGALAVVFGMLMVPLATTSSFAAEGDSSTVRALIGGDGSVSSVDRLGEGEAPAADSIPVKIAISQSPDGERTTTNYEVTNTSVTTTSVDYLDADGNTVSSDQSVALPLVAQLAVRLPASRTDVDAPGARVTKLSDGSYELAWSLVLFSPIGAPAADVSFTAGGTGEPLARLDVAAVQPNGVQGLSTTAQAANATVNGNGILSTVANGANEGLLKLADGVGKLLEGLDKLEAGAIQLNEGIAAGADGATLLAAGSTAAKKGSGELAAGLGQLASGSKELSAGAGKLDAGAGALSAGLEKASAGGTQIGDGSKALSAGATAASAGATSLAEGLALISGGLAQLDADAGLPAALTGAKALRAGVDQLIAGLGAPATEGTILNGLAKLGGGLTQVQGGLGQLATGLPAAQAGAGALASGLGTAQGGVDQVRSGLADAIKPGGSVDRLSGGLGEVKRLVDLAISDASCPPPPVPPTTPVEAPDTNPCPELLLASGTAAALRNGVENNADSTAAPDPADGLRKKTTDAAGGLGQVSTGLGSAIAGAGAIATGLQGAITGVGQLQAGVAALQTGNTALTAGVTQVAGGLQSGNPQKPGIAEGLDSLIAGLTSAVGGIDALSVGAASAAEGSVALAAGNKQIADGAGALSAGAGSLQSGLSQLYTGSRELKAGTGALSAGSVKLADGAGKAAVGSRALDEGIGKINDGQQKVAAGLPAAVDGSGQIADGLGAVIDGQTSVEKGLGDVRTQAVAVLSSQFAQGTSLARQQLAGLDASTALVASTPGAATTTWVLTQHEGDIVATLASAESSGSNAARNAGLVAGGALLLMGGLAGGFVSGRRRAGV